ncbi:N-acetyltransferase family protein [Metabacillus sp. JX24]|uniref:GNAT family N-acetyltransferase n=1 Tax=Metabacillus sp. JX24 TaxID=3240759 RepID=UPI00350FE443
MKTIVRHPEKKDTEALMGLMYEYIVDFYQCEKPAEEKLTKLIETLLKGERGIQFVAQTGNNLVGFATLYFTYSTTRASEIAVMNDLYVKGEFRGKGAAEQLFKSCHTYSVEHHFAAMTWETAESNIRAQRFYARMGGKKGEFLTYSI